MAKKITTEEFIERAKKVHGDRYDYSEVNYVDSKTKVKIRCKDHNIILYQLSGGHLRSKGGCPSCANESMRKSLSKTQDEFIMEAKTIHGNKYNYSSVEYKNAYTKIKIWCPIHKFFYQTPQSHMFSGCKKCSFESVGKRASKKTKDVIQEFISIHGNLYDYSETIYTTARRKIKYKCEKHGVIEQKPVHHKRYGCPKCGYDRLKLTTEEFVKRAKDAHGNTYSYLSTIYIDSTKKVIITCDQHGDFKQLPFMHLRGSGCKKCKDTVGEKCITSLLNQYNIKFEGQAKFPSAKFKNSGYPMIFDFYLPDYNLLIEYDGEQHFRAIDFFGGKKGFKQTQKRDAEKNEYCLTNNIKLLRIPYTEFDNIEEILRKELNLK